MPEAAASRPFGPSVSRPQAPMAHAPPAQAGLRAGFLWSAGAWSMNYAPNSSGAAIGIAIHFEEAPRGAMKAPERPCNRTRKLNRNSRCGYVGLEAVVRDRLCGRTGPQALCCQPVQCRRSLAEDFAFDVVKVRLEDPEHSIYIVLVSHKGNSLNAVP